jgi:Domain of unknown function (DUF4164)
MICQRVIGQRETSISVRSRAGKLVAVMFSASGCCPEAKRDLGTDMVDTQKLNDAFDRFDAALKTFEGALAKKQAAASEAEALRGDRAKIASELDLVRSKATELVTTNKSAVGKIDAAMSRIRAVLHSNSGG